jgi:hypothetical protein
VNWLIVFSHVTPKPDVQFIYKPDPRRRPNEDEGRIDAEFMILVHDRITRHNTERRNQTIEGETR